MWPGYWSHEFGIEQPNVVWVERANGSLENPRTPTRQLCAHPRSATLALL